MIQSAALFPLILIAAVTALVASPLAAMIARRAGLVDVPGSAPHKQHKRSIPDAGGIALAAAIGAGTLVMTRPLDPDVVGILLAALLIGLWGLWDDRVGLSPFVKLVGQMLSAALLISLGVYVRLFPAGWANMAITLLWIVGMANAFNFVDSMDGLALGLGGIAAAFLMLVTMDSGQTALAQLTAVVIGASAGLYYFNALPAQMFLGDSGAQMLGVLMSGIAMAYDPQGLPQEVSWFTPVLVLGVPIFDTTLVTISRTLAHLPLYMGRLDHTYHRLRRLGLSQNRAVLSMHLAAAGLGLLSFISLSLDSLGANLLNAAVILAGSIALGLLLRIEPLSMDREDLFNDRMDREV